MRRLGPLLLMLALAAPATAADTAVDMGDGTAVVVIDGVARRVPLLRLSTGNPTPPTTPGAPTPPPDPAPQPDPPGTPEPTGAWVELGRKAQVEGTLRAKLAAHHEAIGRAAQAGQYADTQALVNADMAAMRLALGGDYDTVKDVRAPFLAEYQEAWSSGKRTPKDLAPLWLHYAAGLRQPPRDEP